MSTTNFREDECSAWILEDGLQRKLPHSNQLQKVSSEGEVQCGHLNPVLKQYYESCFA